MNGKLSVARITVLSVIWLAGCASSTSSQNIDGSEKACSSSGSFFELVGTGGEAALEKCRVQATTECSSLNKQVKILGASSQNATSVSVASAKMTYLCFDQDDLIAEKKAKTQAEDAAFAESIAIAKNRCEKLLGFTPDTPEMRNCILTVQQQISNKENNEALGKQIDSSMTSIATQQAQNQSAADSSAAVNNALNNLNKVMAPKPSFTCVTNNNITTCR